MPRIETSTLGIMRRMRRVLVTGARGMLGRELLRAAPPGCEPVGVDREEGDLAVRSEVLDLIREVDAVVHAAGYTDVAGAENEPDQAKRDNVEATAQVTRACGHAPSRHDRRPPGGRALPCR